MYIAKSPASDTYRIADKKMAVKILVGPLRGLDKK